MKKTMKYSFTYPYMKQGYRQALLESFVSEITAPARDLRPRPWSLGKSFGLGLATQGPDWSCTQWPC